MTLVAVDTTTVRPSAVLEHLEKILASEVFRTASRSSKLLRFLVEETVAGRADRLKDYTLGAVALGRGDSFDPRIDPIARVEASRLRSRLDLYYATEGATDPVVIVLPKGGYVPLFEPRSALVQPQGTPVSKRGNRLVFILLGLMTLGVIAMGWQLWRTTRTQPPPPEMRLEIVTPPTTDPVSLALSPDGQKIVFVASAGGIPRLWLRHLSNDHTSPRALAGTEHASLPFWSHDSESIGFFADTRVKRIDLRSGLIQVVGRAIVPAGGAWNRDGLILHPMVPDSALFGVPAGGDARPMTTLAPGQTGHRGPHFLPDGRHFVYQAMGAADVRGIYLAEIEGAAPRRLFQAAAPAVYTTTGHLLYVHEGKLFARRFDPVRLQLGASAHPVAEQVAVNAFNIAALSASAAGPIAYRTGRSGGMRQFVWFDRAGKEAGKVGNAGTFGPAYPSSSPDDRVLAVQRTDAGNTDIWLIDLNRDTPIRFTTDPEANIAPLWSPNGDRIVFSTLRNGVFNLYQKTVSGSTGEELLVTGQSKQATDWSRDGRFLLFRSNDPQSQWDIWAMPLSGDRKPFEVVRTRFEERDAQFSPDGEWIAYQSDESGRFEIYVQPFQRRGPRTRISAKGGVQVRWRHDGKELFYLSLDGEFVAVPVTFSADGQTIETRTGTMLFQARVGAVQDIGLAHYTVSPDGQRFLVDTVVEEASAPITVILNWRPPAD